MESAHGAEARRTSSEQIDDRSAGETADSGASGAWETVGRYTSKQRSAAHREVERLLDDLAPQRPPARAGAPQPAVKLHRSPGRCVMQAAQGAVSVSWFPGVADGETLGELQLIEWRGVVSLGGSARHAAGGATALEHSLLHPVELGEGQWEWRTPDGGRAFTTEGLARHCREVLARQDAPSEGAPAG